MRRFGIEELSDATLECLIQDHGRLGRNEELLFIAALEERNRRSDGGLDLNKSLRLLWRTGRKRRFVCYKDLADANGAEWNKVRYQINRHLWDLVTWGRARGFPMLSALVVDKSNLKTGCKNPSGLKGFTEAAQALRYKFKDSEAFHKEQQEECFAWAAATSDPSRKRGSRRQSTA